MGIERQQDCTPGEDGDFSGDVHACQVIPGVWLCVAQLFCLQSSAMCEHATYQANYPCDNTYAYHTCCASLIFK